MLGLGCREGLPPAVETGGDSPVVGCRLLTALASLAAEGRLQGARASVAVLGGLRAGAPRLWGTGSVV